MNTRFAVITALTRYDERQSKRGSKYYNPNALPQYFMAVDRAEAMVKRGKTWEQALSVCFIDRLQDVVLKAVKKSNP